MPGFWVLALAALDVLHYDIRLVVQPPTRQTQGIVRLLLRTEGENPLTLHAASPPLILEEVQTPGLISWTQEGENLRITLETVPDTVEVTVRFRGSYQDTHRGIRFYPDNLYTFAEPRDARAWFPCHDTLADKASLSLSVGLYAVPPDWQVVANGFLRTVATIGDTLFFRWEEPSPISPYLIAFAAGPYTAAETTYAGTPIRFYLLPEEAVPGLQDLARMPRMMAAFDSLFGPYPFAGEKYAVCDVRGFRGGMENQTLSFIGSAYFTGDGRHMPLQAHELAHQWWGNWVTPATWKDLWLKEGFASYGDALYIEAVQGEAAFRERMALFRRLYFQEDSTQRYSLYDPAVPYGITVYRKGAWVLHMLRFLLGDSAFFAALREYGRRYAFGVATTEDLRLALEEATGVPLGDFFAQWVYDVGYPQLRWSWMSTGDTLFLLLQQVQENAPVFALPLEVEFWAGERHARDTLRIHAEQALYALEVPFPPESVVLDPDSWILMAQERVLPPSELPAPVLAFPEGNLGVRDLRVHLVVPWEMPLDLRLYDLRGRRVRAYLRGKRVSGELSLTLRREGFPSGLYFLSLRWPGGCRTVRVVWF